MSQTERSKIIEPLDWQNLEVHNVKKTKQKSRHVLDEKLKLQRRATRQVDGIKHALGKGSANQE